MTDVRPATRQEAHPAIAEAMTRAGAKSERGQVTSPTMTNELFDALEARGFQIVRQRSDALDTECTPDNLRCVKDGEPRRNWCLTCLENV